MVVSERHDFRVYENKSVLPLMCGESQMEFIGRVDHERAVRLGYAVPSTVFVRRKDGTVKELSRFYNSEEFTYEGGLVRGARSSSECLHTKAWSSFNVGYCMESDARTLSLLSGSFSEVNGMEVWYK